MEDLTDLYMNQKSPGELIAKAWAESARNQAAVNYIAGMIDGLRFANAISLEEYNIFCDQYLTG